jgi:hypothetical protein
MEAIFPKVSDKQNFGIVIDLLQYTTDREEMKKKFGLA